MLPVESTLKVNKNKTFFQKLSKNRLLCKTFPQTRNRNTKRILNKAVKKLKKLLNRKTKKVFKFTWRNLVATDYLLSKAKKNRNDHKMQTHKS